MRRTREEAETTRRHLLEAGLRIFSEKGYAAARLSDVADAAGVTRGAIYWHFEDKKDLFLALFRKNIDPLFEAIKDVLDENIGPLEKIRKIMTTVLVMIEQDAEFRANQNLEFATRKLHAEIPELREYLKKHVNRFDQLLVSMIKSGIENDEIRRDIDAATVIAMFAALFRGYCFMISHREYLPFAGKLDRTQMINIFIQGIKTCR